MKVNQWKSSWVLFLVKYNCERRDWQGTLRSLHILEAIMKQNFAVQEGHDSQNKERVAMRRNYSLDGVFLLFTSSMW